MDVASNRDEMDDPERPSSLALLLPLPRLPRPAPKERREPWQVDRAEVGARGEPDQRHELRFAAVDIDIA
jgi:hypothetical protein